MMNKYTSILLISLLLAGLAYAQHVTESTPSAVAVTQYRIKLDIHPEDVETRNKLAAVLFRQGKFAEALAEFREVLRISPDNFDAHVGIGLIRMEQGLYNAAAGSFEKAGETIKAIEAYERLLELKDDAAVKKRINELKYSGGDSR